MKCFFRLLRSEPSYKAGFAPRIFGGVFLFEAPYGQIVSLKEFLTRELKGDDILFLDTFVSELFPEDQNSFLHVILNEVAVRCFFEELHERFVNPPKMIGFKIAIDISGLLIGAKRSHAYLALYDYLYVHDVYVRTLVMSVASGYELDDEYDMIRIVSLFNPRSELEVAEWVLNHDYTRTTALEKLLIIFSQVHLLRSVYYEQERHRLYMYEGQEVDVLASEGERNSFDFSLYIMKCRGFAFDKKKLIDLRTRLLPLVLSADRRLVKEGFARSRTDSITPTVTLDDNAIDRYLIQNGSVRRNKNGNILKKNYDFMQSGNEALINYASVSNERIISLVTIPNILDNAPTRNVIHPQYVSYSTTGRASCRAPNMTGIPVEGGVRECFTSREGYTLIIADYDSVEMRVFAQVLLDMVGKSQLAEMYQQDMNFDPHSYLASKYLDVSYEEGKARKASGDAHFISVRKLMKAVNFGFMGGASHETLAIRLQEDNGETLAVEQALKLKDFYFNTFPEIRDYFSNTRRQVERGNGFTETYIRRSKRLIGKRNFTQALNNQVQALASDGALDALYQLTRQGFNTWSPLHKSRPLLSIHDELIIEVPDDQVIKAAQSIRQIMIYSMERRTPNVKAAVGVQHSKFWSKNAPEIQP